MRPSATLMRSALDLTMFRETSSAPAALRSITRISTARFQRWRQIIPSIMVGAKYTLITDLDLTAAYYFNYQPPYGARVSCSPATTSPTCHGTLNAVSLAVDWQFEKR